MRRQNSQGIGGRVELVVLNGPRVVADLGGCSREAAGVAAQKRDE